MHTDYNQPLNVQWMCRLCSSRDTQASAKYRSSKIEEQFREYISKELHKSNVGGKWISAIKQFFDVPTLNTRLLTEAIDNVDKIPGLGSGYTDAFTEFISLNGYRPDTVKIDKEPSSVLDGN